MFTNPESPIRTDDEDLAHAGKRLVVRLWLAGAAVAAATSLLHLPVGR